MGRVDDEGMNDEGIKDEGMVDEVLDGEGKVDEGIQQRRSISAGAVPDRRQRWRSTLYPAPGKVRTSKCVQERD